MAKPPFAVTSHAAFREDGAWVIQVTIRFRHGFPEDGNPLFETALRHAQQSVSPGATCILRTEAVGPNRI